MENIRLNNAVIYFFLHFQYNGFVLSTLMSLWAKYLENKDITYDALRRPFLGRVVGVLGRVCLSWTELFGQNVLYWIGGLAVFSLCWVWWKFTIMHRYSKGKKSILLYGFVVLLLIKNIVLLSMSFPKITKHIFFNLYLIISCLHFTFLGVIMLGILFSLVVAGVSALFVIPVSIWLLVVGKQAVIR